MARVDPDDDDLRRYVVRRYAYDPQRHERRHQVIAAFDNEREFQALLEQAHAQLTRDRAAGKVTDPREHYSGVVLEPGYRRRQRNGRLIRKAIVRGVNIDALVEDLELPTNVGIVRARRSPGSAHA